MNVGRKGARREGTKKRERGVQNGIRCIRDRILFFSMESMDMTVE